MSTDAVLCDVETGACELPDAGAPVESTTQLQERPAGTRLVSVVYVTDPICSAC